MGSYGYDNGYGWTRYVHVAPNGGRWAGGGRHGGKHYDARKARSIAKASK